MNEHDHCRTGLRPPRSGASATERFHADKSPFEAVKDTPTERVDMLAREVLDAVHDTIRKHKVTYDEYNALKAWLINVGQDGEWPLFLDVWVEHVVEDVATDAPRGQQGQHRGPVLRAGCPRTGRRRHDSDARRRGGHPAGVGGPDHLHRRNTAWRARSSCGTPTPTASTRSSRPAFPSGICAARSRPARTATFEITTIRPAPYQIPTDGSCGKLISAAGWHAWRPAHLHVKVSAPGHELLTAQLYFPGDPHNDDDIASAVKPELMLDPQVQPDGTETITYNFMLDPEQS